MKLLSQGKANRVPEGNDATAITTMTANAPTEERPPADEHNTNNKNNENHNDDMCIFILATPGSGSSTMVDLVGTCRPNPPPDPPLFHQQKTPLPVSSYNSSCFISGENGGIFRELLHVDSTLKNTERTYRVSKTVHHKAAWKMYFHLPHALHQLTQVASTILNPYNSSCWGFKEIRHGRYLHDNFAQEIGFLANLCPNPKIILHTRRDYKKEFQSTVLGNYGVRGQQPSLQQRLCFDSYMGMPLNQTIVNAVSTRQQITYPKCQRKQKQLSRTPPFVFRHYLEDYLERNDRFQELWKDFLKCTEDPPSVCQGGPHCRSAKTKNTK